MSDCEGPFLKLANASIYGKARVNAGYSFYDSSTAEIENSYAGEVNIYAEARIKSGRSIIIGGSCTKPARASAAATPSGSFTFTTSRSRSAYAKAYAKTGFDILSGTAHAAASGGSINKIACVGCPISGDSAVYARAIVNQAGDLIARARVYADWLITAASSGESGAAAEGSITSSPSIIYSSYSSVLAKAAIFANQFYGAAIASGHVEVNANSVVTLPNGTVKLDEIGLSLIDYLPQYMQEGDFVKKIIYLYSSEILRAISLRSGRDTDTVKEGILQQFFVATATWGLGIWEASLGIEVQADNKDYSYRRGLVLAQIAARKNESEFWFKKKLEDISGGSIVINPGAPENNPYFIEIETNSILGEQAPDYAVQANYFSAPGNLDGTYSYRTTFVFSTGETDAGDSESNSVTLSNGRIILSNIPVSGSNERYSILNGGASSGTFKLKFSRGGEWLYTDNIPYNATAAALQEKLSLLSNITPDNITVTGAASGPWAVTFTGGLGNQPLHPGLRVHEDSTSGGSGVSIITISEGSRSGAIARKIYRKNNVYGSWKYIDTINDNYTTSYIDNFSDAQVAGNDELSEYNTATTLQGLRFLDYLYKTKPAHLKALVRSNRFRAGINSAGDPV